MNNCEVNIPRWNPTKEESDLFQEWRMITIQHLVSCKKGIQGFKLPGMLHERVDEKIPLDRMGFQYRNISQFLYQMRNDLDVRRVNDKLYIFINESSVPEKMSHIREMVLGQKGKDDKPLRHHGSSVPASELLRFVPRQPSTLSSFFSRSGFQNRRVMPVQFTVPSRGPSAPQIGPSAMLNLSPDPSGYRKEGGLQGIVAKAMASTGADRVAIRRIPRVDILDDEDDWGVPTSAPKARTVSQTSSRASLPTARRYLPGLIEDDDSSSDSGGFDFYSGPRGPPLPLPLAIPPPRAVAPQNVVPENTLLMPPTSFLCNPAMSEAATEDRRWGKDELLSRMKALSLRDNKYFK